MKRRLNGQDISKRLRTKDRSESPGAVPEMTGHARERVTKSEDKALSPETLKFKERARMRGKRKDTEEAK